MFKTARVVSLSDSVKQSAANINFWPGTHFVDPMPDRTCACLRAHIFKKIHMYRYVGCNFCNIVDRTVIIYHVTLYFSSATPCSSQREREKRRKFFYWLPWQLICYLPYCLSHLLRGCFVSGIQVLCFMRPIGRLILMRF